MRPWPPRMPAIQLERALLSWSATSDPHLRRALEAFCTRLREAENAGETGTQCRDILRAYVTRRRYIDIATPAVNRPSRPPPRSGYREPANSPDKTTRLGAAHGHFDDIALQADWYIPATACSRHGRTQDHRSEMVRDLEGWRRETTARIVAPKGRGDRKRRPPPSPAQAAGLAPFQIGDLVFAVLEHAVAVYQSACSAMSSKMAMRQPPKNGFVCPANCRLFDSQTARRRERA